MEKIEEKWRKSRKNGGNRGKMENKLRKNGENRGKKKLGLKSWGLVKKLGSG